MKWKRVVERQNAKKYVWPKGWDTREEVAADLECSPDKVTELLSHGIRCGDIETSAFPVYDSRTKRVVRITGYRERTASDMSDNGTLQPGVTRLSCRKTGRKGTVKELSGSGITISWDDAKESVRALNSIKHGDLKVLSK